MSTKLDRLRNLLRELFQLDQADLDFGIYRIMNQKRDEVEQFLDRDLLPQVRQAFEKYRPADKAAIQAELDKAITNATGLGVDPDTVPKVKELRERLAQGVDVSALEDEVFSDLFNFFRRYYQSGDFLSLRRYKEGVYAIPYEGEEVKLHWANHDQYYIKSTEHLASYAFTVGTRRVRFELAAASTERDNNKAQNGNERRFLLAAEEPVVEDGGELIIRFEYRPDTDQRKQDELNGQATAQILAAAPPSWTDALGRKAPTTANPDRTVLEKHLQHYTAKNTFDYFIHKDLGGFLRRELDFFIKNEILHLDDIDQVEDFARVEEKLSKIRVLRAIAHKIIAFLAQLEDFQKKLWLKKKFVVETNWCITLDRIPEEFYPEIAANATQREEWVRLFAIDEIKGDMVMPAYSKPLTTDFLKAFHGMCVDTRFFNASFRERLLAAFQGIDQNTTGLLLNAENLQAMSLLGARYRQRVTSIFIDPPYNTGIDGFPYKDSYQHSSWISMMYDRLHAGRNLLANNGIIFITIDFVEVSNLRVLCDTVFGPENFLADIAWEKRYTRSNNAKRFYSLKDTVLAYRASPEVDILREPRSDKSRGNYSNPDNDKRGPWISSSYVNPATKAQRPNLVYSIKNPFTGKEVEHPTHAWKYDQETHAQHVADNRLYWGLDGGYEYPRLKSFLSEARDGMVPIDVWHYKDTGTTDDGGNRIKALFGGAVFDNPKPPSLVRRAIQMDTTTTGPITAMDFFAGSGTTGEAVIDLCRSAESESLCILVEMGEHFDTVLKPRLLKATYSPEWADGHPVSHQGCSQMFKYIELESYEDALDNLVVQPRAKAQQEFLAAGVEAREDYMLSYMLDVETRGSASLLNVEQFKNPFEYKLKVTRNNETKLATVDLVETFNFLLGLRVSHIAARVHRTAEFERDEHGRLQVKDGRTRACEESEGWTFRVVEGRSPEKERVLIIWRVLTGDPEKDNLMLDTLFQKMDFSTRDAEFDLIYVNGDNNLENLRRPDETWKVQLIEETFHRLMFDVRDV